MTKLFTFLTLAVLFICSCAQPPERPAPVLDPNAVPTPISTTAATPPPAAEPAQNAQGVWHYTCPTGCTGGGGSATACATCGTTLVHNQAYHAGTAGAPPAGTPSFSTTPGAQNSTIPLGGNTAITPLGGAAVPGATPPPAQPKAPEPPQNAAGVWHYTCSSGCAGGAGSAVACAGCGSTLVHNQAYHQ